jgi:hypothetical protein
MTPRSVACLALFLVVLFGLPVTAPAAEAVKAGDRVAVSIGPAPVKVGTKTLATVKAGTELTALEVNGPWAKVTVERDGKKVTGWIHTKRLKPLAPPSATPVRDEEPKPPPKPATGTRVPGVARPAAIPADLKILTGDSFALTRARVVSCRGSELTVELQCAAVPPDGVPKEAAVFFFTRHANLDGEEGDGKLFDFSTPRGIVGFFRKMSSTLGSITQLKGMDKQSRVTGGVCAFAVEPGKAGRSLVVSGSLGAAHEPLAPVYVAIVLYGRSGKEKGSAPVSNIAWVTLSGK